MSSTYSTHAAICTKFYDLTVDGQIAGKSLVQDSGVQAGHDALFVGSMFQLAKYLVDSGLAVTLADYSDEMVQLGRQRLPGVTVERADLRELPYSRQFDFVFVVGRVFTHLITDDDLCRALSSCRAALREPGKLFVDNYEDSRIQRTNYFNGVIRVADATTEIQRKSVTTLVSGSPFVVKWDASYSGIHEGRPFEFSDSMEHRAWSREEIRHFLSRTGFETIKQGNNFDETSFFTLARTA